MNKYLYLVWAMWSWLGIFLVDIQLIQQHWLKKKSSTPLHCSICICHNLGHCVCLFLNSLFYAIGLPLHQCHTPHYYTVNLFFRNGKHVQIIWYTRKKVSLWKSPIYTMNIPNNTLNLIKMQLHNFLLLFIPSYGSLILQFMVLSSLNSVVT